MADNQDIERSLNAIVGLLHEAMGHLAVAISDTQTNVSPQVKRVVINEADKKVAEAWSIARELKRSLSDG